MKFVCHGGDQHVLFHVCMSCPFDHAECLFARNRCRKCCVYLDEFLPQQRISLTWQNRKDIAETRWCPNFKPNSTWENCTSLSIDSIDGGLCETTFRVQLFELHVSGFHEKLRGVCWNWWRCGEGHEIEQWQNRTIASRERWHVWLWCIVRFRMWLAFHVNWQRQTRKPHV